MDLTQKYNDVLKQYDAVIKVNPQFAEAYLKKGITLYNMKKFEEWYIIMI